MLVWGMGGHRGGQEYGLKNLLYQNPKAMHWSSATSAYNVVCSQARGAANGCTYSACGVRISRVCTVQMGAWARAHTRHMPRMLGMVEPYATYARLMPEPGPTLAVFLVKFGVFLAVLVSVHKHTVHAPARTCRTHTVPAPYPRCHCTDTMRAPHAVMHASAQPQQHLYAPVSQCPTARHMHVWDSHGLLANLHGFWGPEIGPDRATKPNAIK